MGRRIYVHQDSFRNLSTRDSGAAKLIITALLRTKAAKMIHRIVVEDGAGLGQLTPAAARSIHHDAGSCFVSAMTEALQRFGYRPQDPKKRRDVVVVLEHGENIFGTCFEGGYFTFATSDAAASIMYDDKENMRVLKKLARESETARLTIITGRNLVFIKPQVGVGAGKAHHYNDIFKRSWVGQSSPISDIIDLAKVSVASEIKKILLGRTLNDAEMAYLVSKTAFIIEALNDRLL